MSQQQLLPGPMQMCTNRGQGLDRLLSFSLRVCNNAVHERDDWMLTVMHTSWAMVRAHKTYLGGIVDGCIDEGRLENSQVEGCSVLLEICHQIS